MLHTSPRPKFSSFCLYDEPFSSYTLCWKSAPNDPNDLDMLKVKNTNVYATHTLEAQIFVRFALRWAVFELHPLFRKVHRMTPNDLDMFKVKGTLSFISLYNKPFSSYSPIWEKYTEWPLNAPDMFKIKNTNVHATYIPETQFFPLFILRWAIFELRPFFKKVHQMTPKNDRDMFRVKGTHLHTYIPEAQIFARIAPRWVVFGEIEIFEFPIGYNVKIKSLIIVNDLKISKIPERTFNGYHRQESVARVWLQEKFDTVEEGVTFWNFHSHRVPC